MKRGLLNLSKKIETALREACQPYAAVIELDPSNIDRIGGRVISQRFAKVRLTARQDLIWRFLDRALTAREAARISFIVTDTKREYNVLKRYGLTLLK